MDKRTDKSTPEPEEAAARNNIGEQNAEPVDVRAGTGFWNVLHSVGAAMIGVQSSKNRERDFTQGKPVHFIIGGLVGTVVFLIVVWLIVQYLLATS